MSDIKNVRYIWMALNTSKYNHLTPLRFKRLTVHNWQWYKSPTEVPLERLYLYKQFILRTLRST